MIWEEKDYQVALQTQMENNARKWVKNKIDESNGIIRCETVFE